MNGLDGLSAELISATRVALERQLREAEEHLRLTQRAIENVRQQEARMLLQAFRDHDSGQWGVSPNVVINDVTRIDRLVGEETSEGEQLLEELAEARNQAYQCRRAITELNRAIAILGTLKY